MANKISVVIDVAVDRATKSLSSFRKSVADAEGATNKFKVGAGAAMDAVKANAGNLAMAAAAMAVTLGTKAVTAFQDTALEAGKLSDALGIPVEDMSRLMEVAGDLGIETSSLEATIGRMNRTASSTPKYFDDINAQIVKNADGTTDVNETFLETVDALRRIPDATKRAEMAQKIFGRSWQDIAELVGKGSDEIRRSLEEVSDQKVIDEEEVEKARRFRAAVDELADAGQDLMLAVGEPLVGALTDFAGSVGYVANVARRATEIELPGWVTAAGKAAKTAVTPLTVLGDAWSWFADLGPVDEWAGITDNNTDAVERNSGAMVQASIDAALLAQASKNSAEATADSEKAAADAAREHERLAESVRNAAEAQQEMRDATLAAANSTLGYRNQIVDTADAINNANMVALDSKRTTEEVAQASRDAEAAAYDQAASAVQVASDYADAQGATLSASEANEVYRAELQKLAPTMSGEARAAVDALIAQLRRAPGEVAGSTFDIGEALSEGIADGVEGSAWMIKAALRKAVLDGKISAELAAKIESPSKLFAEDVGAPISAGIAEGIAAEAGKIGDALERAIDSAEKDAVKAADDLVDAAGDRLGGLWGGIDDQRSLSDMRDSVADAERDLSEALASGDADKVANARERLEDANYRLAKATQDMVAVDGAARQSWIETAKAGGLTVAQINEIIAATEALSAAELKAAEDKAAISAEAGVARNVRDQLKFWADRGVVPEDFLKNLGTMDPGAQIDSIKGYLNQISRYFGVAPQFDSGGIVPGARGSKQMIVAHGGETVLPTHKGPMDFGGGSTNITINMPPGSDGDSVVRALRQYARRNGPIQGIT